MTVAGREAEKSNFVAPPSMLAPGKNKLRLFCPVSAFCFFSNTMQLNRYPGQAISMGKYLIQATEIRIGNLVFHWDHRRAKISLGKQHNSIIRIPQDVHALDVKVDQATKSQLNAFFFFSKIDAQANRS
jgi:hypothetical protein